MRSVRRVSKPWTAAASRRRSSGDGRADAPEADDADGGAVDVGAKHDLGSPGAPVAGADVAVALGDTTGSGEEEAEGEVGAGLGEDARRARDENETAAGGGDVDVVVASGHVADGDEIWSGGEEGGSRSAASSSAVRGGHAAHLIPLRWS